MHHLMRSLVAITILTTLLIMPAGIGDAAPGTVTRANVSSAGG